MLTDPTLVRSFRWLVSQRCWLRGKPTNQPRSCKALERKRAQTVDQSDREFIQPYLTNSAFRIRARLHGFPTGSQASVSAAMMRDSCGKSSGDSNVTHRLVCNDLQCMFEITFESVWRIECLRSHRPVKRSNFEGKHAWKLQDCRAINSSTEHSMESQGLPENVVLRNLVDHHFSVFVLTILMGIRYAPFSDTPMLGFSQVQKVCLRLSKSSAHGFTGCRESTKES